MKQQKSFTNRFVFQSCVASALLFSFFQTVTGDEIRIRGYIYDGATNAPLADARAELLKTKVGALSDSTGYFMINKTSSSVSGRQISGWAAKIRIYGSKLSFTVPERAKRPVEIYETTDGDGYGLKISSNKTILGADKKATIYGGIDISGVSNVIVRNLNIQGVFPNSGPDDAVAVHNSNHIWIDHLNIWDAGDGNLDIINQSSYITVSWCKFWRLTATHWIRSKMSRIS
jgi:pectate lyase